MSLTLPSVAVVDIASVAAVPDVVTSFDALAPGDALLARTVARPEALLDALRSTRQGTYEWAPLVEGPGHWEVEIHKRAASRGAIRGVNEALGWDHDRLDAIELRATEAWDAGRARDGARLHQRFVFGLLRHIRFEESVLFPEFERLTGVAPDRGPTAVMRVEHRLIEVLLDEVAAAADRGLRPPVHARDDLRATLENHNVKEENVLYPLLDRTLAAAEADALVFQFQSMEPAR